MPADDVMGATAVTEIARPVPATSEKAAENCAGVMGDIVFTAMLPRLGPAVAMSAETTTDPDEMLSSMSCG